jgi:hypothetical protein
MWQSRCNELVIFICQFILEFLGSLIFSCQNITLKGF